jgi:hypothetical protein
MVNHLPSRLDHPSDALVPHHLCKHQRATLNNLAIFNDIPSPVLTHQDRCGALKYRLLINWNVSSLTSTGKNPFPMSIASGVTLQNPPTNQMVVYHTEH